MNIHAHPLAWPVDGWPRWTKARGPSPYKVSAETAVTELFDDLRIMRARNVVLSSNAAVRRDGTPYRDQLEDALRDPGVALYYDTKDGEPMTLACDMWRTPRENIRALGLTISGFRLIERAGASQLLKRAQSGFARLPAAPDCWDVLGLPRGTSKDAITERYRELARKYHPDHGGDAELMARINDAYREATA
jgi:hypothetical protein